MELLWWLNEFMYVKCLELYQIQAKYAINISYYVVYYSRFAINYILYAYLELLAFIIVYLNRNIFIAL